MADIPLPADLPSVLADYERRLRTLETAPRLQNSSQAWKSDYVDNAESTSSTSYVNLATVGPTITMDVPKTFSSPATGDIGRVLLTVSAYMNVPSNTSATVGLFIDGALTWDALGLGNSTGGTLAMNVTDMRTITVTPGTHTFQLRYKQSLTTAQFAARLLIVQPY